MKKIFLFILVLISTGSFAQLSINEDFEIGSPFLGNWTFTDDFNLDYTSDFVDMPDGKLVAFNTGINPAVATFSFSALGSSSITVSWKQLVESGMQPLTVRTSTNNFETSIDNIVISQTTENVIESINAFKLPDNYNNSPTIYLEFSYESNDNQSHLGIDDLTITGDACPSDAGAISAPSGTAIIIGNTSQLTPSILGGTWSSSNPSIASVASNGIVTGISNGSAIITYSISNGGCGAPVTSTIAITICNNSAGNISASPSSTVSTGNITQLTSTVSGGSWSSNIPSIATITSNGAVTGNSSGSAIITYSIANVGCPSFTSSITITVIDNASVFYSNSTGALNLLSSWGTQTDGSGAAPTSFTANGQVFNIVNNPNPTITSTWTVSGTSTKVIVGDGITGVNLTLPLGFSFSNANSLIIQPSSTITLQSATYPLASTFSLTSNTTVNYAHYANGTIRNLPYHNLTISNFFKTSANANYTISGILHLDGHNLIVNSRTLTLNGSITGTGKIQNATTSSFIFGGTGNFNTSSLSTPTISNLTMNSSGILTLNSDFTASGLTLSDGSLNLNNNQLTLNGALNFGSGFITGSSSSSISIGGSGAISGSLNMTQTDANSKSLSKLSLNRSGTTLTIGNALNIYDELTTTAGTIDLGSAIVTLKSSSSQKARVGIVGASGGFSGTLNVETYVPGGSAGWNTLGPAGISGLKVSNWDGGLGSSTTFAMNCSGCILDENSTGEHFVSIQSDPNGDGNFTELTSTSNLTPGTGYWVFIGNSLTTAIDITQTTTGPVVTGNVSSSTGFMSNPYASPILLSALKASNSGLTQIDVYDPNGSSYTSFNGGVPSDVIPAGQGFYASGVSSVIFHESDKIASNTSLLRINSAKSNIGTVFKLKIDGWYGDYDNTYIRFHDNATSTFDNDLDAYKRYLTPGYAGYGPTYSKYTAISTINENKDYSINSLPYPQSSDLVIPVLAKASSTGQYTISPIGIEQLPPNTCVSLKDKLLNITHDLKTGGYVCEINDTTSTPRFELTICGNQLVTGINKNTIQDDKVLIGQDGTNGVFVKTNSLKSTKYVVSAYNIMGQKMTDDRDIIGTENLIYLDLKDLHHQVIIIKVTSEKETITKKVYLN